MFFDRLFLRVALTLFCSMFCASEMLAVPPGQDLPTPNTSTKRKVSESRGLPEDYLGNSSAILSTPGIFSSQTLALGTTPAKEKHESENKRSKTIEDASEEDADFWASAIVAADAAEEEHRRAHSRQASLTPVTNPIDDAAFWAAAIVAADAAEEEYHRAHSQESPGISLGSEQPVQQLLSSPSARAPSLPEPEGHSPLAQRALSGTTDDELIHLLDEVDGGLRQVSSYSSAETQKNKVGKEQGLSSTAVSSAHSAAPARKQEDRVVKRKAERNLCGLKPIRGREHFHLLKNLIRSARDEILITTESIGFIPAAIIDSLRDAGNRRVKISVYSNKEPSDWAYDFFEEEGIRFEQLNIHGKHLIIDRSCAVIGSCNWLGFSDEEIGPGERSIEISGNPGYIHTLRGRTYSTIIKYREIFWSKMNNEPAPHTEFDEGPLNLSLNTSSQILLLTTLQHHEDYLKFICRDAKKYITIYSPFIIFPNAVRRLNMIAEEIKDGVELRIF